MKYNKAHILWSLLLVINPCRFMIFIFIYLSNLFLLIFATLS